MADCAALTIAVVVSMPRVIRVVRWPTPPVRPDPAGGGTVGCESFAALAEALPGAPRGLEPGALLAGVDSRPEELGALTWAAPASEEAVEGEGGLTCPFPLLPADAAAPPPPLIFGFGAPPPLEAPAAPPPPPPPPAAAPPPAPIPAAWLTLI